MSIPFIILKQFIILISFIILILIMNLYRNFKWRFALETKLRDRYIPDYQYYKSIPKNHRQFQLQTIFALPTKNIPIQLSFAHYPINNQWQYNNTKYKTYFWQPKQTPKGVLITLHALNSHTNYSGNLAKKMSQNGIVTAGYDYKNFGGSNGNQRGKINSLQQMITTTEQFILHVKQKYPYKLFISGDNFGGALAFLTAHKNCKKIAGTILMNPTFKQNPLTDTGYNNIKLALAMIGKNYKLFKPSQVISSQYDVSKLLKQDQLVYKGRMFGNTYKQLQLMMKDTVNNFHTFNNPFLFIQGGSDKVVNPFQILDLEQKSSSNDKTCVIINELWHSVYFDRHADKVYRIIQQWIKPRL